MLAVLVLNHLIVMAGNYTAAGPQLSEGMT